MGIALNQAHSLEQEIRQRQELRIVLLESAVGASQLDTQGRYIIVNQAYASMLSYQPEEMMGWNGL